jgi:hypothetical protein
VPDEETLACCLYEYARELARGSSDLQAALKEEARYKRAPRDVDQYERSFKAYNAVSDFLETPRGMPYWQENMAFVPWVQLSADKRRREVERLARTGRPVASTCKYALKPGDEIPGLCVKVIWNPSKRGGRGIAFTRTASAEAVAALGVDFLEFVTLVTELSKKKGRPTDSLEFGMFAIDWNNTNEALRAALLDWLDKEIAARGKRRVAYSKRGRNNGNELVGWLRALGAMRLRRSGMSIAEAMEYSAQATPAKLPLFRNESDWSKAHRKTFPAVMRKLFGERAVWEE